MLSVIISLDHRGWDTREEFIIRAHADYLAATIPGAKLIILPNVAPLPLANTPQHSTSQSITFSIIDPINCGSPEIS
jgi:hypothetical protein